MTVTVCDSTTPGSSRLLGELSHDAAAGRVDDQMRGVLFPAWLELLLRREVSCVFPLLLSVEPPRLKSKLGCPRNISLAVVWFSPCCVLVKLLDASSG